MFYMDRLLSILVMNEGNFDPCLCGQVSNCFHKETNDIRLKDGVTNTDSPIFQAFLSNIKNTQKSWKELRYQVNFSKEPNSKVWTLFHSKKLMNLREKRFYPKSKKKYSITQEKTLRKSQCAKQKIQNSVCQNEV